MKKNDQLIGKCIDYTYDGLGIVKTEDFTFFVRNVLKGEEIRFIVTKMKKNYGYGKCLEVLKSNGHRQTQHCRYFPKCGGCQIQHMDYDEQLAFKQGVVENNLRHMAHLEIDVLSILGCETPIQYRNKAQFPVAYQKDTLNIGFYRLHSKDIVDLSSCALQSELINQIMLEFRSFVQTQPQNAQAFKHLLIKHAFKTHEAMVVFIVREKVDCDALTNALSQKFPQIKSIMMNVNARQDNVILGEEAFVLYGREYIVDELDGLQFQIGMKSFYQVNAYQTKVLYDAALTLAQAKKTDEVLDLYCGVGTLTLYFARFVKHVTGVEIVAEAIENAKANALRNHIENVDFICSDSASYAQTHQHDRLDMVIVDPPRKGLDEVTRASIALMNPLKIVYVSCNPATLARDLACFEEYSYQALLVQPVDMFPQTHGIENVALLKRKSAT